MQSLYVFCQQSIISSKFWELRLMEYFFLKVFMCSHFYPSFGGLIIREIRASFFHIWRTNYCTISCHMWWAMKFCTVKWSVSQISLTNFSSIISYAWKHTFYISLCLFQFHHSLLLPSSWLQRLLPELQLPGSYLQSLPDMEEP